MSTINEATLRQNAAANPARSVWLSANAGSGKTRVLTDRVARLLLEGVDPQNILCLTYTKAAASEMQNRLFKRLGEWAMLSEEKLHATLDDLGVSRDLDAVNLAEARRLFALAVETPGGLKIQTIHSFCSALLRRFPLEAGVAINFQELDDAQTLSLREEALDALVRTAPDVVNAMTRYVSGASIDTVCAQIVKHQDAFDAAFSPETYARLLGLKDGYGWDDLRADVFLGGEADLMTALLPLMSKGSVTDQKSAAKLSLVGVGLQDLPTYEGAVLTGATAKVPFGAKSFPTKAVRSAFDSQLHHLDAFIHRIESARPKRIGLRTLEQSEVLHRFATAFLAVYQDLKTQRGVLDFDDLILKAGALLSAPDIAAWVLFKLDGGIDHILVDEAQDTSPAQWRVVKALAQDFTSGDGTRDEDARTIFVVGDKKQSIYSFQGADPDGFDRMAEHFRDGFFAVEKPFESMELQYSFRSAASILGLVDMCFAERGGYGVGGETTHKAFLEALPGRVDLWPLVEPSEADDPKDWYDPLDLKSPTHHDFRLAQRIAREIAKIISDGTPISEYDHHTKSYQSRPVRAGDFLILVQRRSDLFRSIIRCCKQEGLDIAGADRLKLGEELAVKDLISLLSFLAMPEDDLALAETLKSPLFNLSEAELYDLAHGRKGYLWPALREAKDRFPDAYFMLSTLLNEADFLRPYELIERVLTGFSGRQKFAARFGQEAEDGIETFVGYTLSYEQKNVPSLTGFLNWFQNEEIEVKRQMDSNSNKIRVMSVHGAKGLEAPIVILPDSANRRKRNETGFSVVADNTPLWAPSKERPDALIAHKEAEKDADLQERMRLLYVALTRAEKWLIVCAAGKADADSWYRIVEAGMKKSKADPFEFSNGIGLRLTHGAWPDDITQSPEQTDTNLTAKPPWFSMPPSAPQKPVADIAPSGLGGAKGVATFGTARDQEDALHYGTLLHQLLEELPLTDQAKWDHYASRILHNTDEDMTARLTAKAMSILSNETLKPIFAASTLSEVGVSAPLADVGRISGAIDKLIVKDDVVTAIDFKSNHDVPARAQEVPEGILRQMGAYRAALKKIYPNHDVKTEVLWLETEAMMALDNGQVDAAFQRALQERQALGGAEVSNTTS
ncbi:MAG: double-strand break repair helicase AddA [Halocynthiibacter sp.]